MTAREQATLDILVDLVRSHATQWGSGIDEIKNSQARVEIKLEELADRVDSLESDRDRRIGFTQGLTRPAKWGGAFVTVVASLATIGALGQALFGWSIA